MRHPRGGNTITGIAAAIPFRPFVLRRFRPVPDEGAHDQTCDLEVKRRGFREFLVVRNWRRTDLTPARAAIRLRIHQERAVTILESFREWLGKQKLAIVPESPLAKAVSCVQNNCEALTCYGARDTSRSTTTRPSVK
jgi:hypothetical protein